jgi:DNA-binding transcriptional LysR family regulator
MEFNQLEYCLAVAKYRSFTKASEEINVSQSALSIQISKLESELNVQLFDRTTRSVYLTSAGKKFINLAQQILDSSQNAKRVMQEFSSGDKGTISVGMLPGAFYFGFTKLIYEFKKQYPDIILNMQQSECFELINLLKNKKIDIACLSEFNKDEYIKFYPYCQDQLVLVTSPNHPLAYRNYISIEEIPNESFILTDQTTIYKIVSDTFTRLGLKPNISLQAHGTQLSFILGLVSYGLGVTLISSRVAKYYKHWDLSVISLFPPIPRYLYLAVSSTNDKLPVIKKFKKFILNNTHSVFNSLS